MAPTSAPGNILVKYSVRINETSHTEVTVRKGSVFLDVMKAAQEKNETLFRYVYIVHGILQARTLEWGAFAFSRA